MEIPFSKFVNAAIAVVALFAILIIFVLIAPKLQKELLSFGEESIEQPIKSEVIKEKFDNLVNTYNECYKSEKTNCICIKNFPRFPSTYELQLSSGSTGSIISIYKSKELKTIHESELKGPIIECFTILEKDNGPYKFYAPPIPRTFIKFDDPKDIIIERSAKKDVFTLTNELPAVYKHDKEHICFVTKEKLTSGFWPFTSINKDALNYFKGLPLCK